MSRPMPGRWVERSGSDRKGRPSLKHYLIDGYPRALCGLKMPEGKFQPADEQRDTCERCTYFLDQMRRGGLT